MYTLYHFLPSCSLACLIALEQSGADYQVESINLMQGEQGSEDYLKLNPKGRVPLLVTPHGKLSETPAILAYIAQSHPEAQLAPLDDAFQFARMQAFNSYMASTVHVAHAHALRGSRWADDQAAIESMKRKVPESVAGCYQLLEDNMVAGPWVLGERYSVSDSYLFAIARWLERDQVDIKRFPKINDHFQRMLALPAVAKFVG